MKLRRRSELSQEEAARRIGVRRATLSDWERGVSVPAVRPSTVKRMMDVYQCSLDELIEAFEGIVIKSEGGDA